MAKFIELTDIDENIVSINVDNIIFIRNDEGKAFISLLGKTYAVAPDYDKVIEMLKIVSIR